MCVYAKYNIQHYRTHYRLSSAKNTEMNDNYFGLIFHLFITDTRRPTFTAWRMRYDQHKIRKK